MIAGHLQQKKGYWYMVLSVVNEEGKPIALGYFSQSFKQFLRGNGLREIRLHDLRIPVLLY